MPTKQISHLALLIFLIGVLSTGCDQPSDLEQQKIKMVISEASFRFSFERADGTVLVPPHPLSGLVLSGSEVVTSVRNEKDSDESTDVYDVVTQSGDKARVELTFINNVASFKVRPQEHGFDTISLRLGGMPVAHGLGDAGAYGEYFNLVKNSQEEYPIENNGGQKRWVSTFTIFPYNKFAGVYFDKGKKSVTVSEDEYSMTITKSGEAVFYYFLGDVASIYSNYKKVREKEGFYDVKPKFRLFELGWESWDALGWNTNQTTVREILEKFHQNDYPIRWAVTGSGFWDQGGTTTSFGRWGEKFSDVPGFKTWMDNHDIKWMIGLRTNFIPEGGPYFPQTKNRDKNLKVDSFYGNELTTEARMKGYLVSDANGGTFKITSSIFPIVPSYLLDGNAPGAAKWYQQQYSKWNVDGIKEDTMMGLDSLTNIFNSPITAIAEQGGLVMARNGEFTAPGTLLRINDTRVGEISSRIPINYLQYAASGFPNVYSDVAGTHNMKNVKDADRSIRHTWLLSLTSGMAVGAYPEKWPDDKQKAFKKAVDFHYVLAPYMFSASIDGFKTGYPQTLTPMTIAFPEDTAVANVSNYQWMIGESLLATPLLKNHESGSMDIYLPEGVWYDYESGIKYEGPKTLEDFEIPLNKVPCFVGGKGILLERARDQIICKVYPITINAEARFTGIDGATSNTITINNPNWNNIAVWDLTSDQQVNYEQENNALTFAIEPDHDYTIK